LRWYVAGLNTAGAWAAALFGARDAAVAAPFAGFYAPSGYFVVALEAFAILLLACAAAAEYLGTVFARLSARISAALAEAQRGQELWTTLIEQLPAPALLVDADTLQVICASERFAAQYCVAEAAAVPGRNLFETTHFSYPDVVEQLIAGKDGVVRPSMIRVADRLRVAEVRVQHVAQKGRRLALVIIEDITEGFCLRAALDTAEYAALVVDSEGRVMAFNKSAPGLVPGNEFSEAASRLLSHPPSGARWWDPGVTGRRKMHVELLQRTFQVTSSTVALPGEAERFSVLAFLPVGKAAGSPHIAAGSTVVKSTLVQLK
jgi:PAS domain-containing protein